MTWWSGIKGLISCNWSWSRKSFLNRNFKCFILVFRLWVRQGYIHNLNKFEQILSLISLVGFLCLQQFLLFTPGTMNRVHNAILVTYLYPTLAILNFLLLTWISDTIKIRIMLQFFLILLFNNKLYKHFQHFQASYIFYSILNIY